MSSVAFSVSIAGRVQGVGFRRFVQRCAEDLGVRGWVRNLPDGSVECEVEGAPAAVERFLGYLRRGSAMARVERCEVAPMDPRGQPGFTIR